MIMRWWYAIKMGWQQRKALKRFLVEPTRQVHALSELTLQRLDEANVAILILDFDGVLAPHDQPLPLPVAKEWLTQLSQTIGEQRIALFTNKPISERIAYFQKYFPSIFIVHGVRKKPYPEGILQVAEYKGVAVHRVALLDDRLLTGMLSVCLAYSQGYYFTKPYQNYCRHPFKECFFSCLRHLERWFISAA
jgi:predicted HAD superfamily phosphohydrolase YqeG